MEKPGTLELLFVVSTVIGQTYSPGFVKVRLVRLTVAGASYVPSAGITAVDPAVTEEDVIVRVPETPSAVADPVFVTAPTL